MLKIQRNSRLWYADCRFLYHKHKECEILVAVREDHDCEHSSITCQYQGDPMGCPILMVLIGRRDE